MTILLGLIFWALIIFGIVRLLRSLFGGSSAEPIVDTRFAVYERKKFLLDSNAELAIFRLLVELYHDRFYIFPQVNYSHLVQVRRPERFNKGHRSRFDKKSADFVLCDKATVVPQLVIELDGPTHATAAVIERDGFVDGLMRHVGLPMLHIQVGLVDKDQLRAAIDQALKN
jgi:very-short-patch-repair endonuclease